MHFRSRLFYSYLIFLIVYSAFVLLPAPPPAIVAQYHVSVLGLRLIDLTIIVLLAAIWFTGFYGYAKLRAYAELIRKDKDGQQIARLSQGLFLIVLWLPVSSTISAVLNYIALHHPGFMASARIINNYINLLLPLAGFIIVGVAARGLSDLVSRRSVYRTNNLLVLFLIYIGLIYYRLVATTPDRGLVYHLPIWLLLTTIVAPYIYMWFIGLQAAYDIYRYHQKVQGIVYRRSWGLLAFGFGWLIATSICFQYITTLSGRLNRLSIYWLLLIIYALLVVLSVGFILISLGTRKLQRIEEV